MFVESIADKKYHDNEAGIKVDDTSLGESDSSSKGCTYQTNHLILLATRPENTEVNGADKRILLYIRT
jgi:hypothetical protein